MAKVGVKVESQLYTGRSLHRLTVLQIRHRGQLPRLLSDGGGLFLRVKDADHASWIFRYSSPTDKRRREMGLGALADLSLAAARERAKELREQVARRIDPIDRERADRAASKAARLDAKRARLEQQEQQQYSLRRLARRYHETAIEPNRTVKHGKQWIATLETHVFPTLGDKRIDEITHQDLIEVLSDLQRRLPETASRVRQRLEAVFDWAVLAGQVAANPVLPIKRELRNRRGRRQRSHFRALQYQEAPGLARELRTLEGVSARALEFALLSAARTQEVLGMAWDEVDLRNAIWTVPASRMKARREHVVFLATRAREILASMKGLDPRYVFPSPAAAGKPMSNMALLATLRRLKIEGATTVHGLRATFSTWANETGTARPDVIEAALAHGESNAVRAAYSRAQYLKERRELAEAWAQYLGDANPARPVEALTSGVASGRRRKILQQPGVDGARTVKRIEIEPRSRLNRSALRGVKERK